MLTWVYEKGKSLFYNILNRKMEDEIKPAPVKKTAIIPIKSNGEAIKWPLPSKK